MYRIHFKAYIYLFLTIILILFHFEPANAQRVHFYGTSPSNGADSAAIAKTQGTITALMEQAAIPGLAVAIARGDRIIYADGYGLADIESGQAVFPDTKFRIGSISKQLTAALMMKLAEDGRLDIDAPISNYLPSLNEHYGKITARQLAGHLGGVRHYKAGEYFSTVQYDSVKGSLQVFINDTLLHKPGTEYEYSTYGYVLLSAVLEAAAGKPFLMLMREAVLDPLGLGSTVAESADSIIYRRAEFYRKGSGGEIVNAPSENYSSKWAGGGYLSSAEDLAKFGIDLIHGRFLNPQTVDEMFRSQRTASGEETAYGIGWRIDVDWEGRKVVRHGGSSSGSRSFIALYPEHDLSIVILTNMERAPVFEGEAGVIADYFLDNAGSVSIGEEIEGTYRFRRTVNGEQREGSLMLVKNDGSYSGAVSNLYSSVAPVVNVQEHEGRIVISVATASGIANLWLQFDSNGFKGKYGWDSPGQEIEGVKQ